MGSAIPQRFFLYSDRVIQRLIFWLGYRKKKKKKRSGRAQEREEIVREERVFMLRVKGF